MKEFACTHSIAVQTLKKYLSMTEEEVEKVSERHIINRGKDTMIGPYLNIIYKMLRDGFRAEFIYSYIYHLGYEGNPSTIADIIKCIALNNFKIHLPKDYAYREMIPPGITVVERSEILKYITVKDKATMKDTDAAKYIDLIKEACPAISQMEEMYQRFYSILMGGEPDQLDEFITQYTDMKTISGFITGLKRDIAPVKNAISLPVSSGFVEGNNNKFKLIKRILFGRSGLSHLFHKCYAAFSITQSNVSVQSLIPGLGTRMETHTQKILALTQT